ncbi:MAG: S-methyl-5-thioribose-1-phosphate isomerase [Candidatus Omnitrophota bacterium]|nr:S-methyl-5-thioribose-1-phosphate isomerase [Candidatus Omnitrophota bacterium]
MTVETIKWIGRRVKLIDQRKLPAKLVYVYCGEIKSLWKAIRQMQVRGAPAIGIAGALGVVLGIQHSKAKSFLDFKRNLEKVIAYLASSRPTAVNLFNALKRMRRVVEDNCRLPVATLKKMLLEEALKIVAEDKQLCRRMAGFGAKLIKDQDNILTICNAGALATADYGTALGVMYKAKEKGKRFKVFACETRPLLQGARLTAWELERENIDTTLICDNMAASLMAQGKIDKIFVGADRIAANGDTANKIGTYNLAVLAEFHKIPFYVVAPSSSFDLSIKDGAQIPIEQRDKKEVTHILGKPIAPSGIKVYNPAFDVTPGNLITAIITERGIIKAPYNKNIKKYVRV